MGKGKKARRNGLARAVSPPQPQPRVGAVDITVGARPGQVHVAFNTSITNITLPAEEALKLGRNLMQAAHNAMQQREARIAQLSTELGPETVAAIIEQAKTGRPQS